MDHYGPNVIWVRLKGCNLFGGIVIVHSDVEIVGTANDPILAGNESSGSHRNIGEFKSLDDRLWLP